MQSLKSVATSGARVFNSLKQALFSAIRNLSIYAYAPSGVDEINRSNLFNFAAPRSVSSSDTYNAAPPISVLSARAQIL